MHRALFLVERSGWLRIVTYRGTEELANLWFVPGDFDKFALTCALAEGKSVRFEEATVSCHHLFVVQKIFF